MLELFLCALNTAVFVICWCRVSSCKNVRSMRFWSAKNVNACCSVDKTPVFIAVPIGFISPWNYLAGVKLCYGQEHKMIGNYVFCLLFFVCCFNNLHGIQQWKMWQKSYRNLWTKILTQIGNFATDSSAVYICFHVIYLLLFRPLLFSVWWWKIRINFHFLPMLLR